MANLEAVEEIEISASVSKCLEFFKSIENVGSCIPGSEEVRSLGEGSASFKIRLKVGYISKVFELRAKINAITGEQMSFSAEGSDAEIQGSVKMTFLGENLTKINYKIEIKPTSVMGKTAVSMIGKDLIRKQANEFASCVKKKLEA
ncbi:MAG: CoxG family protein [Nitrososphaerales archaeon]